jgi:hypothetical protein
MAGQQTAQDCLLCDAQGKQDFSLLRLSSPTFSHACVHGGALVPFLSSLSRASTIGTVAVVPSATACLMRRSFVLAVARPGSLVASRIWARLWFVLASVGSLSVCTPTGQKKRASCLSSMCTDCTCLALQPTPACARMLRHNVNTNMH